MKVGIVLATYNPNRAYFLEQVESLKSQSENDWICILSDDSNDPILKAFIQETVANEPRFRFIENRGPKGVLFNFENGVRHVPEDVDIICFCDQDDIWDSQKLAILKREFKANPWKSVAHSDLSLIDGSGNTISDSCWAAEKRKVGTETDLLSLVLRNQVTGCSMCFRKELLKQVLPFPDSKGAYLHDHWIAAFGHTQGGILNISRPLVHYRQHGGNVIGASQKSNSRLSRKISRLFELKSKSVKALGIRHKLAFDLVERMRKSDPAQAAAIESTLWPLLKPSKLFFLKGLLRTKFQWPEFGLWLQLFVGSLFWKNQ